MMQVCTIASGHIRHHLGQALEAVADDEERVLHAAVAQIGEHRHPELRTSTTAASPEPADVALAGQRDADGRVERPIRDLAVADLDHDRVDEDRRVGRIEWPHRPLVHLLEHLVGDPTDGLLADRGAVDLGEVRGDLAGGQALGIEREHHLIDPVEPALPLAHDLRLERAGTIPRDVDLDLASVLGQHRLRPGAMANVVRDRLPNDKPCSLASRTSSAAACCSADCSAGFFFATPFSVVVIRRQPFPPSSRSARQAAKTVSRTVPTRACLPADRRSTATLVR
jgi:hypothetical protein